MSQIVAVNYSILLLLFMAVTLDLRDGKIPNGLTMLVLTISVIVRFARDGPGSALEIMLDVLWPALILYFLFYIRVLGAGDIKLICGMAPLLGTADTLKLVIISFVLAAGFSCWRIFSKHEFLERMENLFLNVKACVECKRILKYSTIERKSSFIRFSVFILAGFIVLELGVIAW